MPGVVAFTLVAIFFWLIGSYNRVLGLKRQVADGWRKVDVQLKRRRDLIPNLVNALGGPMDCDRDTLASVLEARTSALSAMGPNDAAQKEHRLSEAVDRFLAAAESQPAIGSNDSVKKLQERLLGAAHTVGVARQSYNDIARRYNLAQQGFPMNLLAGACGFRLAELFEVPTAGEREAPVADSSRQS